MVKTPRLIEALMHRGVADLQMVAETRGIAVPAGMPRGELVALLATELPRPNSLQAALEGLDVHERRAWNAVLEGGGLLHIRPFMYYFGQLGGAVIRAYRKDPPPPPRPRNLWSPSEGLWYRGLVFSDSNLFEQIFVPAELLAAAGEPLALPAPELVEVGAPAELLPEGDLLGDITAALSMMKHQPVKRVRGGELARKNLVALNAALSLPHDWGDEAPSEYSAPYLRFLLALLHDTGIVSLRDSHLVPSASANRWLASPRHDQMRQAWRWYLAATDEGAELGIPGTYGLGRDRNVHGRKALVESLRRCPVGQWLDTESFLERLQHEQPQMLRSWRNESFPFVIRDQAGRPMPAATSWSAAEGRLTRSVLTRAFRWLGLVMTDQGGDAFQITSLGAFLMGSRSRWDDEPAPRPIIVQPNFEILAPAEANLAHVFRLEDFADLVKRDRIATYTLTQESLRRALVAGESADEVIDFLAQAAGRAVPQNVAFSLREWAGRYGEVEIRNLTVLTVTRDSLLDEIRASARLKLNVQTPLGPRAVAIEASDLSGLLKRLRKAGYSPKVDAGAEASGAATPQVQMPESELMPLLAAAMAVERLAGERVLPPGLTARLQRLLSLSSRSDLAQQAGKMERAMPGEKQGAPPAATGNIRFASAPAVSTLLSAIRDGTEVNLDYYDPVSDEMVLQRVTPLRIESHRGTHHLIATATDSEAEERYLMDHIRSAQIVGTGPARR